MDLIKVVEDAFKSGKEYPPFRPGDTITVSYRIKEGQHRRRTYFPDGFAIYRQH